MSASSSSTAGPSSSRPIPFWPVAVALVLAVLASYANSFRAPFIFDDIPSIRDNASIRQLGSLKTVLSPPPTGASASGRPLANLSFALNYAFGGLDVHGYHAVNIALHAVNALLLLSIVGRTLRRMPRFSGREASALAPGIALLWALHPLQTETVVCVVQRTESLVAFFYLLSFYAFLRYVTIEDSGSGAGRGGFLWPVLAVVSCAAGMATKEVMVTAPVLLLVYDRTFFAGTFREAWRRRFFYLALAGSWLVLLGLLLAAGGTRGTTAGFALGVSPWAYALTQCRAIVLYLQLAVWPTPLVLDYGRGIVTRIGDVLPQLLLLTALITATGVAFYRRSAAGFLATAFFVLLSPSSSFVPLITQTIAEHRMYLPLAAVVTLFVIALHAVFRRATYLLLLVVAGFLGFATFARNQDYRSAETIWADTVRKSPNNGRAWYCLGMELLPLSRFAEAKTTLARAVQLEPQNPEFMVGYANALASTDEGARAIELYRNALGKLPRDYPMSYEARHNLGVLLMSRGQLEEAIGHLRVAIELRPAAADSRFSLGNALVRAGRPEEAVVAFEGAITASPAEIPPRVLLAGLLLKLGRFDQAVLQYEQAIALAPNDAQLRYTVANQLLQNNRTAEAALHYEKLIDQNPAFLEAHNELGIAYAQLGRLDDARQQFQAVLRLQPAHAGARENLERLKITPR